MDSPAAERKAWIRQLFRSIDDRDTDAFLTFLSDDVLFGFGNAPPVTGKAAVGEMLRGFFASIKALRHEVPETWDLGDTVICHGTATYTRKDSTTLRVPFANIFRIEAGLITEYLIFVDVSGLYATDLPLGGGPSAGPSSCG